MIREPGKRMTGNVGQEFTTLLTPPSLATACAALAAPVVEWFQDALGQPTAIQRLAWPTIAAGQHALLCAPTGNGKTLAAFLPILSRLLTEPEIDTIRCLYLAPLKALSNDARHNLRTALRGIRQFLPRQSRVPRVGVRTGDTSSRSRQALLEHPPDILLTTPESLAVMLCHPRTCDGFRRLRWVVVDEIHALAGHKRGADLSLSLERLANLVGGPLQRVGLSATCAPLEHAAHFLVGNGRGCTIAQVADAIPAEITIEPLPDTGSFLSVLVARLEPEIRANQTTLVFTNRRSLAERLTWVLSCRFPQWADQMAVHHSSLAAVRRRQVERRLKQGHLRVVVSSTSLELGIDIGTVEGVVLVHPPGGVIRLVQRIGRSGHRPGQPRRGLILTATAAELLEAAVTNASRLAGQGEPLRVPRYPLDVLCQQLLGMAAQRPWTPDTAFALVRQAYPYSDLPRRDFDDCLDYLSGRRADGQSWLPARLGWFADEFSLLDERTGRLLRRNLGTILAEEMRTVRCDDGRAVGQVAEPFADRLQPGDRFLLDGRCLELQKTAWNTLIVHDVPGQPVVPRWGSEGLPLSAELARRLYLLREQAAEALHESPQALTRLLEQEYGLEGQAMAELAAFFERQECLSEIPNARTCLVECAPTPAGPGYFIHTPLARAGNDALARVVVLRLARRQQGTCSSLVADLGFAVFVPAEQWCGNGHATPKMQESRPCFRTLTPDAIRELLHRDAFETDLAEALRDSLSLRERFQRVAQTGLMLLRNPLGRQRRVGGPDWAERRLFARVRELDPDFVLLRQALREIREESCDALAATRFLEQLSQWTIHCRQLPQISPFAEAWTQPAAGPTESVSTPAEALQRLHAELTGGNSIAG
jgi:ATP-dependent Lhr-like helicase